MAKEVYDGVNPPFMKDALFELRQAIVFGVTRYGAWESDEYVADFAADLKFGDFYTNVAIVGKKKDKVSPQKFAEEFLPYLVEQLGKDYENIHIAGPGFMNVFYSRKRLAKNICNIIREETYWGKREEYAHRTYGIEYSCPNPFKEMHLGHLMNTILGESICRIKEFSGAKVIRDSYGGDVGPHVAKAIWGLKELGITEPTEAKQLGDAYVLGAKAYEEDEGYKKEIDAINVSIYTGDNRELTELWRRGRDVAQNKFNDIYRRLGVKFDYIIHESEVVEIGMQKVKEGLEKGIFEESEGAVVYKGEKVGLHTLVFITSRGTPTYEAKDIGLAYLKEERIGDTFYNYIMTASEQIGHFKVFIAALKELAPRIANKTFHIPTGLLSLTSGKMSSREGNVLTAEDLMNQLVESALTKNEDPVIAEQVAMGALNYLILRAAPGSNVVFDMQKALSLDGDSGPYLQYALVRAQAILKQTEPQLKEVVELLKNKKSFRAGAVPMPDKPYNIERLLPRFREWCTRADKNNSPHYIAQYLIQLAGEFNSFYANERVIGDEYELYKVGIVKAFESTMRQGLHLLNIPTPEKM